MKLNRKTLEQFLYQPVNTASLAVFRILFGAIAAKYYFDLFFDGIIHAWYIETVMHLPILDLFFLKQLPDTLMILVFILIIGSSLLIMLGWHYRFATITFFSAFTYIFLLDQTYYQNHLYLMLLIGLLFLFIPANRALSLDVYRKRVSFEEYTPAWNLYLLRFQYLAVFFFAGIAKINRDWLKGEPNLEERLTFFVHNTDIYTQYSELFNTFIHWGGIILDIFIVPLLLFKKTRIVGIILGILFMLLNDIMFDLPLFLSLVTAGMLLFLAPEWPYKIFKRSLIAGNNDEHTNTKEYTAAASTASLTLIVAFVLWQIFLPFRHLLYPGRVNWTQEGDKFAWHQMLHSTEIAFYSFEAYDPASNTRFEINTADYLTPRQETNMLTESKTIRVFAHQVAKELEKSGYSNIEIYANVVLGRNGREPQPYINPEVNLLEVNSRTSARDWIYPQIDSSSEVSSSL